LDGAEEGGVLWDEFHSEGERPHGTGETERFRNCCSHSHSFAVSVNFSGLEPGESLRSVPFPNSASVRVPQKKTLHRSKPGAPIN
jgi:hypothetical protein